MTPKQILYLTLTDRLAPLWRQDEILMEADPVTWRLTREIDEWLCEHRDNLKVGEAQYRRNCERLLALYVEQPATEQRIKREAK